MKSRTKVLSLYEKSMPKQQKRKKFNQTQKKSKKKIWLLILAGAVIGFLNGFFGGGGGMVCVPVLKKVLFLSEKEAHATAIWVIFPISLISCAIYVYRGFVSSYVLLFVSVGCVLGGVLGSVWLKKLQNKVLAIIFAVVMLAGGIKLLF